MVAFCSQNKICNFRKSYQFLLILTFGAPLIYSILTFLTPFLLFLTQVLPHSYSSLTRILSQVSHVCTFPFPAQALVRILDSNPASFTPLLAHISPHILSTNSSSIQTYVYAFSLILTQVLSILTSDAIS